MAKIEKVVKGQIPSLLDTQKANELIEAVNGLLSSRASAPLKLVTNSDGSHDINLSADPMEIVMCVDGRLVRKVIFVQQMEE